MESANIVTSKNRSGIFERYGMEWNGRVFSDLEVELWMLSMDSRKDGEGGRGDMWDYYKNAVDLLWNLNPRSTRKVIWNEWSEDMARLMLYNRYASMAGSASCVSGDTVICVESGMTIKECCEQGKRPKVMTLEGVIEADVPYLKGEAMLYDVVSDDGGKIVCTDEHRFLCECGWKMLKDIGDGGEVRSDDGCRLVKLKSVEFNSYDSFYDLNVPVYHHYFAGGMVNHNSGKCFSGETMIRMFDGSEMRADWIRPGDKVMGDDGVGAEVIEAHDGFGEMYEVVQSDGSVWRCNGEHDLVLRNGVSDELFEMTVNDYLGLSDTRRNGLFMVTCGYDLPEKQMPIDPRMFGIWLGDGDTRRAAITQADSEVEVVNYIHDWAERVGDYTVKEWKSSNSSTRHYAVIETPSGLNVKGKVRKIVINSRFNSLIKLSTITGEKRIPDIYMNGSYEQRMELLAGIIDTDGHASNKDADGLGSYYDITLSNKNLCLDIQKLARSLGFIVSFKHRMTSCNGKMFDAWRVCVCGKVSEVPCLRKKCRKHSRRNDNIRFKINAVGVGAWHGFEIDNDSHRFLLANGLVVHNSDAMAVYGIVKYLAYPQKTKVIVSSTTIKMAHLRIWRSVSELWLREFPGKMVYSRCLVRGVDDKNRGGFTEGTGLGLIPPAGGVGSEVDSNFLGIKQDRLIVLLDEFSELPHSVLNACYGNLANGAKSMPNGESGFEMKAASNPNLYHDSFGMFSKPLNGWASVNLSQRSWETSRGMCMRFDAEENPNIKAGKVLYPWLPTKDVIEQAKKDFGEQSRHFYRMYKAAWFSGASDETIFSEGEIIKGGADTSVLDDEIDKGSEEVLVMGGDPAFTQGGDRFSLVKGRVVQIGGKSVLEVLEVGVIKDDIYSEDASRSYSSVRHIREKCLNEGIAPSRFAFDMTGAGIPFRDIVVSEWSSLPMGVNFGGSASDLQISPVDKRKGNEVYGNRVSELWGRMKGLMREGRIRGLPNDLISELVTRQWSTHAGGALLRIESKRDYKKRIGQSCDLVDGLTVLVELVVRSGLMGEMENVKVDMRSSDIWQRSMELHDIVGASDLDLE